MNNKEKVLIVSIINYLIELYCKKTNFTIEESPVDVYGIGVTEDGKILSANGDDLEDTLGWVFNEIVPKLSIKKEK